MAFARNNLHRILEFWMLPARTNPFGRGYCTVFCWLFFLEYLVLGIASGLLYTDLCNAMQKENNRSQAITEATAWSLWSFYPEVMEMKKKKKCCKSFKTDKRCKKCPANS